MLAGDSARLDQAPDRREQERVTVDMQLSTARSDSYAGGLTEFLGKAAGDCGPCATGWRYWAAQQTKRRQVCQESSLLAIGQLMTESQPFRTVLCSSNIGTCNVERRGANELAV